MDDTHNPGRPLTTSASVPRGLADGWLALLLVLIVSALPVFIVPGQADSKRTMENITVTSTQETWLRQHGWQDIEPDAQAWLMPSYNGSPRIVKPPLVIWLDMLAWTGLTPEDSTAQQLIGRARLVSAGMGLMVVLGVYWIGAVLWDRRMAVLAALVAGTCLFLTRQARIASYDMHMTGWATLSVAGAVWAMRPFKPAPGHAAMIAGWGLAGVGLAGAFMSKGPLALLVGAGPVLTTLLVARERWQRNTLGLVGMLLVAGALTGPWYFYAMQVVGNAEGTLLHEYKAERMEYQTPLYYLGLIGLMLPWSVWLIGGLLQPFMRAGGEQRRKLMVAWAWFGLIFVAFSLPGAKQQRYILPIIPAAALLIGQLWHYHQILADKGEIDPGVNLLRVPHWAAVVAVSLAAWPFFTMQAWMLDRGWFEKLPVGDVSHWVAGPAGLTLIGLGILGALWHFKWRPMKAGVVLALWSSVMMTLTWYAWSTGPRTEHPVRADAESVGRLIEGGTVGMLKHPNHVVMPNEEFLLYARRILPMVRLRDMASFHERDERVYLVSPQVKENRRLLRKHGYERVRPFQHDYDEVLDLWHYTGERTKAPTGGPNPGDVPSTGG